MLNVINTARDRDFRTAGKSNPAPQGLILAAGRGQRLGSMVDEFPKCLLKVGGQTLLDHQLSMLNAAGITDICVVTGYKRQAVTRACGRRAHTIINPRWSETNSLFSLWLARNWVNRAVVVMNCDVLIDPVVLPQLLVDGNSSFAFDSGSGSDVEHMKVQLLNGSLKSMSKTLDATCVHGENVGMLHFSEDDARRLFDHSETLLGGGAERQWMAAAVQQLSSERELRGIDIRGSAWIEIDYAEDLDVARKSVWPTIGRSIASRGSRLETTASETKAMNDALCYGSY